MWYNRRSKNVLKKLDDWRTFATSGSWESFTYFLTLLVPCISESYIEMKIKGKFLFSHFFVVPSSNLLRHHKEV